MKGYRISDQRSEVNLDVVHGFISNSYWAKDMPKALMASAIENSMCFSVFDGEDKQVGFARIISDQTTFAYLADVFVLPAHRGNGLSKWLMETIMAHPKLQGLRRFMLATSDAHGLYKQYGFDSLSKPGIIMEIANPDVYKKPR